QVPRREHFAPGQELTQPAQPFEVLVDHLVEEPRGQKQRGYPVTRDDDAELLRRRGVRGEAE
ncbi:MAG: hypothetical protein GY856_46550, partial [bacterium]|nr:hypothetical protein [bacterium]